MVIFGLMACWHTIQAAAGPESCHPNLQVWNWNLMKCINKVLPAPHIPDGGYGHEQ